MSAISGTPHIGIEAQHIYLRFNGNTEAYDLLEDMLPLSYELHMGREVRELIADGLAALRKCTTEEEADAVFAASREAYERQGFASLLTKEKEGGWTRTMRNAGLDAASGHFVDVGNPNNKFGDFLLRHNSRLEKVTGVDHRIDPGVLTGERLHFAHQEDESAIPLPDAVADVVGFRLALHHMTTDVQEALLREASRILRPGGEILIIEDSYTDAPALNDNALTMRFNRLGDEDKYALIALLDASSCLTTYETIPFPFTYRSITQWEEQLRAVGCGEVRSIYWGFPMFTQYNAPMGIIRGSKASV
ncbi:class I SAM-dependent methyltransferase [Streptomyces sp. NBC_01102]|uniref:class I SAM-dependent methyltransferase n=1 Tax=unclassified Streptomyces TaxID=2593676 RepID=UPI00386356E7|nr:class I SAM-dependent methyltransferase [Streptomyces sp. NBC_01102]